MVRNMGRLPQLLLTVAAAVVPMRVILCYQARCTQREKKGQFSERQEKRLY